MRAYWHGLARNGKRVWRRLELALFHRLGPDRLTLPEYNHFRRTGMLPLPALVVASGYLRQLIFRSISAERDFRFGEREYGREYGTARATALPLPGPFDCRGAWRWFLASAHAGLREQQARYWDWRARWYADSRGLNYLEVRDEIESRR
jgi:hypothetical protein